MADTPRDLLHGERRVIFQGTQRDEPLNGLDLRSGTEYTLMLAQGGRTLDLYAGTDAPVATFVGSFEIVEGDALNG